MGNTAELPEGGVEALTSSQVLGMLTGSGEDLAPRRWPRVSRGCYDKFRRCPGWAGGGMRYARVRRCDNGFLKTYDDNGMLPLWWLRFYRCRKCGVLVLPHFTKNLDPSWLRYRAARRWEDLRHDLPRAIRDNFSWWDEETGEWAAWAAPREVIGRLPWVIRKWARSRARAWRIRHGR